MNELVGTVTGEMEKTMNHSLQQSTRIQELDAVMQQLRKMAEQLRKPQCLQGEWNNSSGLKTITPIAESYDVMLL